MVTAHVHLVHGNHACITLGADGAYVLAFSLIMLNTDAHSDRAVDVFTTSLREALA